VDSFGDWIVQELKARDWRQADLARAMHMDSAVVHNLITGNRGPGVDTCNAIAKAFGYPPEMVFRIAGLLPPSTNQEVVNELMSWKIAGLTDAQLAEVINFIDFIQQRDKKKPPPPQGLYVKRE